MAPHVLVADDDAWILRMVSTVLEKRGYQVETAGDGEEAMTRAIARPPDLLITDVMMPRMDAGQGAALPPRARPPAGDLPDRAVLRRGSHPRLPPGRRRLRAQAVPLR